MNLARMNQAAGLREPAGPGVAMPKPAWFALLPSIAFAVASAGPVTTVPWNGHPGAVSFTYDDARTSQIPNLLPQLDDLKIKATFFISVTGAGGDFEARKAEWIRHARNGHELANHTRNHVNMPADPSAAAVIADMAKYLRELDPAVESVTFAYPNCNVNGKAGIGAENFIARSCGGSRYAWGAQPADWLNIQGMILGPGSANNSVSAINAAKAGNSWQVLLSHDVKEMPDAYSITPAENKRMLDAAVAAGLWADTYQNIGAYYRAHFTMDAVEASATPGGWRMTWTSPHPRMPKSVKLRVKLASTPFGTDFTVRQDGAVIPAESDGSYVIDFMKLSLDVLKPSTGAQARIDLPRRLRAAASRYGIEFGGVDGPIEAVVADVRGNTLFRGRVSGGLVPLRKEHMRGILFLTLIDRGAGASARAMVNATR
jgi:peptidoglycan/xylan/chitin deacetylase (PgdA/CDA1 family)